MEASDATSPTSQTYNGDDIFCECNMRSPLQTSRTDSNPGRRFFGCPKYQTDSACGFFNWYDPPTCKRGMKFGRMILKENRELKRTLKEMQQQSSIKGNEEIQKKIDELERRNQDLERVIHELLKAKSSGKNFWKILCFVLVCLWIVISLCNPVHKPKFLNLP
ncbi:hypothetical protein RHMOL_Rhmol02G0196400 [Rhododendron molle]|uniref:Uncharacterized protein n=1 Tax=Rhododendron molle TaxID=49168 RepID=A0ACC0PV31_RHOML|nr:hypothetical protein RHMOL_Rhmol02G0196400 [Rhododendron molle]